MVVSLPNRRFGTGNLDDFGWHGHGNGTQKQANLVVEMIVSNSKMGDFHTIFGDFFQPTYRG